MLTFREGGGEVRGAQTQWKYLRSDWARRAAIAGGCRQG